MKSNASLDLKRKTIWCIAEYSRKIIAQDTEKFNLAYSKENYLFWIYYIGNITHTSRYADDLLRRNIYKSSELTLLDYKLEFLDGIEHAIDFIKEPEQWLSETDMEAIGHAVDLVTTFMYFD